MTESADDPKMVLRSLQLVRTANWRHVISRFPLFGGQGTLNVNSWSPDGRRFGFVAYPVQQKREEQ
jgi:TolB protein